MDKEIWKEIDGTEGAYEVSNKGRIRSYKNGRWGLKEKPHLLKPFPDPYGYVSVDISGSYASIHRLVAKAFIPNPRNKPEINHKNGIKDDNRVSNLEWVTKSENCIHACKNKMKNGELHGHAKLTEKEVLSIRAAHNLGVFTQHELANAWDISRRNVRAIINKRTWKHI